MKTFIVTRKTLEGYVHEVVMPDNYRVIVAGGFHSEYTGKDGDVAQIRRDTGDGYQWFEAFVDVVQEVEL